MAPSFGPLSLIHVVRIHIFRIHALRIHPLRAFAAATVSRRSSGSPDSSSPRNLTKAALLLAAAALLVTASAPAQSPVPLPYTMTTLAGTSPMASAAGTQCPNLPTGVVSTDAFGDGCLAVNAIFGAAARGGLQVDAFGNVFVDDDVNSIVHVINPTTGIMTVLAGGSTACTTAAGAVDSAGDGCIAATQTKTSSQRGIGIDPYGNVYLAGYGDNIVHMVCRAASPRCTAAQIGTMQIVAGCIAGTSGASGGVGLDNVQAAQLAVGTCSTAKGEVDGPRGVSADIYGNVYFADTSDSRTRVVVGPLTSSFFTGNNPLYAVLGVNYASVTQGYAYTVVNIAGTGTTTGGAATTLGQACANTVNSITTTGAALDTYGDGCPFNFSSVAASSGYTSGVAVDASGNMVFTDPSHGLRVLYVSGSGTAGTLMTNAIVTNNPGVTPQPGFIYLLWGGGATALGLTPTLGTGTAATDTTTVKVTVSPQGNIYIGDTSKILSFDIGTGYIRELYASSSNVTTGNFCNGTSGQKSLSPYSDGCAASQSIFSNSSGLGIAVDGQNNLYAFDASSTTKMLVRKILAQGFAAQTVGAPQTQNFDVHFPESAAGSISAPTATLTATPDMTAGAVTCSAQYADNSFDCTAPVTTTPSASGLRSATLSLSAPFTASGGSATTGVADLSLAAIATGSALAIDNASTTANSTTTPLAPTTSTVFSGISPAGVALDGAGNLYTMDLTGGHFLESIQGAGVITLPGTLPTNPAQLAVDPLGDVFAVGSGTSSITELAVTGAPTSAGAPASFTATSVAYAPLAGTAAPQAVAVDSTGNLFVADKQSTSTNTAIYRLSRTPNAAAPQATVATGFTNPVSLAVDPSGNVYVADKGAPAVYKLTPGLVNGVPGYIQTTVSGLSNVIPAAVATDAAGDLYVQDAASLSILEVPITGPVTTVATGLTTPTGLAIDGKGNVYSADAASTSIAQIVRNAVAYNFGTNQTTTFAGTLTDVGNQPITGSNPVTNTTNFAVTGGTSNGCSLTSSVLNAQAAGNACTLSAAFVGSGSGTVSDVLSYLPAASTLGSLTLTGTLSGTAVATTTTITNQTPVNPVYVPGGGTEVTFTVTVAASSGTPGGTVTVTVDSTTTNPSLTNGVATVTLSGLTAGTHTISAAYATSGSFSASNSGPPLSFSIAQDTTTVAWTPAATTVQFGSPVGTSALNATATYSGSPVPGVFVYTANGAEINAATYLPIGSYTLAVTFIPTDAADYSSSTAGSQSFAITQASTTASVGATQMLVAADGTGNYTSVQTAINALPTTGGSLYIKPGTYTGFVTVVTPNVSMYGLGGNPANVILTNQDGAFSAPFLPGQGVGNNGSSGDQGSATMVVARGTVNGFTGTPSNFYAENFTLQNTYDTDAVNTTTNASVGGTCTANQPAQTFAALYNSGTLCNSQALAFWITGDQAVLNNINTTSQQDTIYAGSISGSSAYAARQYWFRGKVTGDVDYIFGDAAAVFDHTSIYTTYHGASATGTETIEAQNKADQTGASPSYLSGYIMNSDVFTSQSPGMTNLYFGRPYGHYSTWIMLNSHIDQVAPVGYIEFQGDTNLPTSTYAEYNNSAYTDPATGSPDINGVPYLGAGGNTGSGVTGTRETTSTNPGTPEVASSSGFQIAYPSLANTTLSQAEAQQYYPIAFLSTTVPTSPYNTVTNWNPTAAIAAGANAFVPAGTSATVAGGSSVTILIRPQTPGVGAITNGVYTIPTGGYTLHDTINGNTTTLASGTLDASGSAFYTSSALAAGAHSLTWTYTGDANFTGSTTATPYVLTVTGTATTTTTTLSATTNPITYGQSASLTATVASASGTPTGSVTLTIDGATTQTATLSNGAASFATTGLTGGSHSFSASYAGGGNFAASATASNFALTVNPAPLTVTATCANRLFDQINVCSAAITGSYQYADSAATIFATTPTAITTATRVSQANTYATTPAFTLTAFGSANYAVAAVNGSFTITGGAPQTITFSPLPNFTHGASYQLTDQTTSGLPITYSVTSGSASVSGTTLTVNAAGPVTIQAATATDPTGDYALATPVTRSFTAQ